MRSLQFSCLPSTANRQALLRSLGFRPLRSGTGMIDRAKVGKAYSGRTTRRVTPRIKYGGGVLGCDSGEPLSRTNFRKLGVLGGAWSVGNSVELWVRSFVRLCEMLAWWWCYFGPYHWEEGGLRRNKIYDGEQRV